MENRIKNQQLDLFADRASCRKFWPNQFRELLSGLAYTLFEALLRVGAVELANTRRIRLLLSSAHAHHALFRAVALRLDSP